jgi:hypothetical protein
MEIMIVSEALDHLHVFLLQTSLLGTSFCGNCMKLAGVKCNQVFPDLY